MFIKFLKKIGIGKIIALSDAGIDDLKVTLFLIGISVGIVVIFTIPWIYGIFRLLLKLFI